MKTKLLILLGLFAILNAKSQQLESILIAAEDANRLIDQYTKPSLKGLIYSVNGGWFTTAKTHEKFGFDIVIGANASFVSENDKTFLFNPSEYNFLTTSNGGNINLPTVLGNEGTASVIDVKVPLGDGNFKVASFEMPGGIAEDLPASGVPTPLVQVGFGLPTKTDIKLRFVPNMDYDDRVNASLFGVGVQHDLTQYFLGLSKSNFSLSVLGAFTTIKSEYALLSEEVDNNNVTVTNGLATFNLDTWTAQAIGGLDFKVINLYASVGYNQGSSSAKLLGDYTLSYRLEDGDGNDLGEISETLKDPINFNANIGGVRGTVGFRLNLSVFKIFADYTLQEYNTLTAGIAVSVR